jgi:hypothetical protein
MFEPKYKMSILNSQWVPIKRNLKLKVIPRKDEYIFLNDIYYKVLNLVHVVEPSPEIFVIVDELKNEIKIKLTDNQ